MGHRVTRQHPGDPWCRAQPPSTRRTWRPQAHAALDAAHPASSGCEHSPRSLMKAPGWRASARRLPASNAATSLHQGGAVLTVPEDAPSRRPVTSSTIPRRIRSASVALTIAAHACRLESPRQLTHFQRVRARTPVESNPPPIRAPHRRNLMVGLRAETAVQRRERMERKAALRAGRTVAPPTDATLPMIDSLHIDATGASIPRP